MLITLVFLPIFLVFGVVFGFISWFFAAWLACSNVGWTKKWQSFSRSASRMSRDHNVLAAHGADFVVLQII